MSRQRFAALFWAAKSPLLFGLRLWASVCLALYIAFSLELDKRGLQRPLFVCQVSVRRSARPQAT